MMNKIINTMLSLMAVAAFPAATWAQEQMAVTAVPFMLKGAEDVNNVKLIWDKDAKAQTYVVYRDGEKIAEVAGVMLDHYDLPVSRSYTYHIDAISPDGYINSYVPVTVATYHPEGQFSIYDNFNGKYLNESENTKPQGFNIKGKYYKYSIERTDKSDKDAGWVVRESVSNNGMDGWSKPRLVYRHKGCNFEGNAFNYNPVTGKIVLSSQR